MAVTAQEKLNVASHSYDLLTQKYGISEEDIKNNPNVEVTHVNLNDDTVEGIKLTNKYCFSVQYHPEASP